MMRAGIRIAVINPNTTASMTAAVVASASSAIRCDTDLIGITPQAGVATVETNTDEVAAAASVLEEVRNAEASDRPPAAYVIACFGDTGLAAAREAANGPVVGMTEAALVTAALVAHRFTVVTMPRRTLAQSDRVVRALGLEHRCAVRAIDVPVSEVADGASHLLEAFVQEGLRAQEQDCSEAVILGCAGLADLVAPLQERLGMPVIEGVVAAVTLAEGLVAQGVRTSRTGTWGTVAPQPAGGRS
jgi:allantoin racemase